MSSSSRADVAASEPVWGNWPRWCDQGNGIYRNPVLPSDYSDLDCIRVGSDYYAISSTFQYSPGMVVPHSKDLVNWKIIGHVADDLTQIGPELNWDRMNRSVAASGPGRFAITMENSGFISARRTRGIS